MVNISVNNYQNAKGHTVKVNNKKLFWVRMIDVQNEVDVRNMSDLIRKEIHSIYETKKATNEQVKKYKRKWKEYFNDEYDVYVRSDIIEKVIMHCKIASLKSIEFKNKLGLSHNNITLKKKTGNLHRYNKVVPRHKNNATVSCAKY